MSTKPELKIIADHLRSSCFLIADGVLPSNEGRGYVLRRIMRRAMRQLHKLGAKEAIMYKLVDSLINEMGKAYPELSRARDTIIDTLKNEEEKFRETLGKGLKILEEEISNTQGKTFSGKTAFKLYDTYGFPLDLTQDILKEKNIEVDEVSFHSEMEKQRQRARKNWAGSGESKEDDIFFRLKEAYGETEFVGYTTLSSDAKIVAIETIADNQTIIILDKTPFYATSGGQKGDDGRLISRANTDDVITIDETKKFAGNLFVHFVKNMTGEFKPGDTITAEVNSQNRQLRCQNHSATHLMHKALKQVLGNSISQKGSNVDAHYFTFDFNFNRSVTKDEINNIETLVNQWINDNSDVQTNLMDLEKARETGAEALFGEKYDSEVRVVSMGPSVELCGGTHVTNTAEIDMFKIISEKSIASGIRRIEARTALGLKEYLHQQEQQLQTLLTELQTKISNKNKTIAELSGSQPKDDYQNESDPKIIEEALKKKDKEIERLKKQILLSNLNSLQSESVSDIHLVSHVFDGVDAKGLRDITNDITSKKDFAHAHIFALFGCNDGKVATVIAASNDLLDRFDSAALIKPVVEKIGGKGGGGKKDLAMGGGVNKDNISEAVETLKELIK